MVERSRRAVEQVVEKRRGIGGPRRIRHVANGPVTPRHDVALRRPRTTSEPHATKRCEVVLRRWMTRRELLLSVCPRTRRGARGGVQMAFCRLQLFMRAGEEILARTFAPVAAIQQETVSVATQRERRGCRCSPRVASRETGGRVPRRVHRCRDEGRPPTRLEDVHPTTSR